MVAEVQLEGHEGKAVASQATQLTWSEGGGSFLGNVKDSWHRCQRGERHLISGKSAHLEGEGDCY